MSAAGSRTSASLSHLEGHPAVAWMLGAAFFGASIAAIHGNVFLNNEGVYNWMFSGLMSESLLDMLFLLKARPPLALLYAPIAPLGLKSFFWAHALLASAAIPLTASLARRLGHRRPNLPALLVALSPLCLAGAAAGVQNSDAMVGLLAVAWLLATKRPVVAGLLLSLLVLARVETSLFAVAFAAYALFTPATRRLLVSLPIIPIVYVLCGAFYHRDLLWPLTFPSFPTMSPVVSEEVRAHYGGDVNHLLTALLTLTPTIGALAWLSLRGRPSFERLLILTTVAFLAAIRILPFTNLVYVDDSPRYLLPALPYLALGVGLVTQEWGRARRSTLARAAFVVFIAAILGWQAMNGGGTRELSWLGGSAGPALFVAVVAWVAAALVALRSQRVAIAVLIIPTLAAAWALLPATHLQLGAQRALLDDCLHWIRNAARPPHAVVVTDMHLLRIWVDEYAPDLDVDVRHVVTPDTLYDATILTNPRTNQFNVLFGSSRFFYAPWIFIRDVATLPSEALVVMRTDIQRGDFLKEPPFDRVQWSAAGNWLGGRLPPAPAVTPP